MRKYDGFSVRYGQYESLFSQEHILLKVFHPALETYPGKAS